MQGQSAPGTAESNEHPHEQYRHDQPNEQLSHLKVLLEDLTPKVLATQLAEGHILCCQAETMGARSFATVPRINNDDALCQKYR